MAGIHVEQQYVNAASELNPWGLQKGRGMLGACLRNEGLVFGGRNALHYSAGVYLGSVGCLVEEHREQITFA